MTTATLTTAPAPAPPAPQDVVIKCAGLTKVFKDFWLRSKVRAVDAVDLDVRRGEVFGLLGPNGSGKSTTIKLILGLLHPTAGRIAVFGKRPEDVATKKMIGYLPEESYLYRFLDARETLDYYGQLFHQDRDQRRRRIDMLLEMVGLQGVARRPVGEYSKGMQRRIGLAQALINDPALLILDEPTTGLDPIGTRQIKDLILELSRRGKTILLCSHLLADVEDVCDRVAIMFGGKVRALGTVDELLTRQDMTTLQTSVLDVRTIEEIELLLESKGKHLEKVEQPRQKLEALFLQIVQQAQAEGAVTGGALAGGKIAEFLVGPPAEVEGEAVLEQLVQKPAAPAAPAQPPSATPTAPPVPPTVALADLLRPPAPAKPAAPADPFDAPPSAEEAALIDQLVSGKWASEQKPAAPTPAAAAPTPRPAPAHPADPYAPPAAMPAAAPGPADASERPDESFLNALKGVPAFEDPPAPPAPAKPAGDANPPPGNPSA